jgi:hypothetical protein
MSWLTILKGMGLVTLALLLAIICEIAVRGIIAFVELMNALFGG